MENIDIYYSLLKSHIIETIVLSVGLIVVALAIWLMFGRKSRNAKLTAVAFLSIMVLVAIWFGFSDIYPVYKDYSDKSIIIAENVIFEVTTNNQSGYKNYTPKSMRITFSYEGTTYNGAIIINNDIDSLPEGKNVGTVVFAPNSNYVLDIIFYEEIETDEEN